MKKWVKRLVKIILGLCALVLLLILSLHTGFVKNLIRDKLQAYLSKKTKTEFRIGSINYRLPKWVEIDGVLVRDQLGDTLLSGKTLLVDLDMFKLIKGQYIINRVKLEDINIGITRRKKDSSFNYQFIIDAFASKGPAVKKDTSAIALTLHEIEITNSRFNWKDEAGGLIMQGRLQHFKIAIDSIDLKNQAYVINNTLLDQVVFQVVQKEPGNNKLPVTIDSTNNTGQLPRIRLKDLTVNKSTINYTSSTAGIKSTNSINYLQINKLATVPQTGGITLDAIKLDSSNILFEQSKKAVTTVAKKDTLVKESPFAVTVNKVDLNNNNIFYSDLSKPKANRGVDYNHIGLANLVAKISDITYANGSMKAKVQEVSFKEKSGLKVDTLHGEIAMDSNVVILNNALLVAGNSRVEGNATIYPAAIAGKGAFNEINIVGFRRTVLAKSDLQLLLPTIMDQYRSKLSGINRIYIDSRIKGTAAQMDISQLLLRTDNTGLLVDITGRLKYPFDTKRLWYDLRIKRLVAVKRIIEPWVNTTDSQKINLPPSLSVRGSVRGGINNIISDLTATSTYGQVAVKGSLGNFSKPNALVYNLQVIAKELETGKWINKDSLLGKLNGTVYVKGSGIDYKTATISSRINLQSFRLQQHVYTGIAMDLNGVRGTYKYKGGVTDPLLMFNLDGKAMVQGKYPQVQSKLDIINADLGSLGFYKDSLRIQTFANVQANDLNPATLDAFLRLDSTSIYRGRQKLYIDSIVGKGYIDSGLTFLTLRSSLANATAKGKYQYDKIGGVFQQYVSRYSGAKIDTSFQAAQAASIDIEADIKPNPIYALLLPGIFFDKNIHLKGFIDTRSADSSIYLNASIPYLAYNSNAVSALRADVQGVNDSLKFSVILDTARSGNILLNQTSLTGGLSNRHVNAAFITRDEDKKPKYQLSVTGNKENEVYNIKLGDTLKLNYQNWLVNNNNLLRYGNEGINISQLEISNSGQRIAVNSSNATLNAPLSIIVERFQLSNIMGIMNKDSMLVNGVLSANITADGIKNKVPSIDGTVKIDSLNYNLIPVGNLAVNAKTNNTAVTFDGGLTGYGNNVELTGNYDQNNIDATINLAPIKVQTLEAFSAKNLARSKGNIIGTVNIKGPVSSPAWNGNVRFDSASTSLAKYGTVLRIEGQEIKLQYPQIAFNKFTIKDSANHTFTIDGTLTQQEKIGFVSHLSLDTREFIALSNTPVDNNELYGTAIVNLNATIDGPVTAPDISGNVKLRDKSNVTYVRQTRAASEKDREGVIEFIDMDTVVSLTTVKDIVIAKSTMPMALNYNLNIDVDPNAELHVIIDPLTRDELIVKGAAQLNAGVNPNGEVALTGAYNLTEGSYQLNYQFLKRKFILQEGSTILFSGDPKDAEANITAIYEIETEPLDLIGNEIESGGSDNLFYRQKMPFQVILKIKGSLMEPKLEFDIKLKENVAGINNEIATTIDNKLAQIRNDVSAMNKQVFALLVMNRFIGEQSRDFFSGGGGGSTSETVKASVSSFLAEAVNQVATDLIKGVDIDIDLKSIDDYSTATQRTDLNLALSKRFLNDRLSVTVGKNFTVEGDDPVAKSQNNSNLNFLPDITTNYKLSRNGRYMLRAYRRNQYEAILDGYFIETGVAFSISLDYVKFKQIFNQLKKRPKRNKEKKNAQKK